MRHRLPNYASTLAAFTMMLIVSLALFSLGCSIHTTAAASELQQLIDPDGLPEHPFAAMGIVSCQGRRQNVLLG